MANVISWITSHWTIVVGCSVAVIDFVMALVPSLQSNGILHAVYLWLKGNPEAPKLP